MGRYIIKRLLLIVPTLIGIVSINFLLVQLAPGGPVDQAIAQVIGLATSSTMAVSSGGAGSLRRMPVTQRALDWIPK